MSSARAELVALLRAGLPTTWDVRDFDSDELGNLTRPTVTVQHTALTGPLSVGVWTATLVVDVVAPHQGYTAAEQTLEDALLTVLTVLRATPAARNRIDGAQRVVRAEKHHAWRITLTIPLKEQ